MNAQDRTSQTAIAEETIVSGTTAPGAGMIGQMGVDEDDEPAFATPWGNRLAAAAIAVICLGAFAYAFGVFNH